MFSETLQKPKPGGRNSGFLSACLFFLWTAVRPLHFTGPWKREPGIQKNDGDDKLFHYLWLSCNPTTRQDKGWSSTKKKASPMISLTSLFCHRFIQNSFQVTWATRQTGNVGAATKGTSIWVLAVVFRQTATEISPQYPQITVPAVPLNILLIRKERSP